MSSRRSSEQSSVVESVSAAGGAAAGKTISDTATSTDGSLAVFPAMVEFQGITSGTVYCIRIRVRNTSRQSLRIRATPPSMSQFSVKMPKSGPLAPGLEVVAEVEFTTEDAVEVHDVFSILSETGRVDIPLHAYLPAPKIVFDSLCNLGTVVLENSSAKYVELRNEGFREGSWSIEVEDDAPLRITPSKGTIAARGKFIDSDHDGRMEDDEFKEGAAGNWIQRVKVELIPENLGVYRTLAKVRFPGQPSKLLDITATVVEQRLELLLPRGGGPLTHLNFGGLYFGETREIRAVLVNNGPAPCSFSAAIADRFEVSDSSDVVTAITATGHTFTPGLGKTPPDDTWPVTVLPVEGVLKPYAEQPITFVYKPIDYDKPPAFRHPYLNPSSESKGQDDGEAALADKADGSASVVSVRDGSVAAPADNPFGPKTVPFVIQSLIACPETHQKMVIDVTAAACKPVVEVSLRTCKFGECPTNERRDVLLMVRNPGETLPLDFSIGKVANFRVTPSKGRLQPLQSLNVVVSFCPAQLGRYSNTLHLTVGAGLATVPIRVMGKCTSVGKRKEISKGVDAPPAAFATSYQFVPQGGDTEGLDLTATLTEAGFENSVVLPSTATGTRPSGTGAPKKKWTRPDPLEELEQRPDVSEDTVPSDPKYTYTIKDLKEATQHKAKYNGLIRKQRQVREEKATRLAEEKAAKPWHDSVSLGLNPVAALVEPHLPLPRATEELWLKRPLDEEGKPVVGKAVQVDHDPTRIIKRKFKPKATTQAELRDCRAVLTPLELKSVSCGPKTIDFGLVAVRSTNKRCFSVVNNLSQTIIVELKVPNDVPEVAESGPVSQVIPSGATAGFTIVLSPREVQDFASRITYVINGNHTLNFNVLAEVRPIVCAIQPSTLTFQFPEDSTALTMSRSVTISNSSNAPADYRWAIDAGTSYSVSPQDGSVPPHATATATVTFEPSFKSVNDTALQLIVQGGDDLMAPPSLRCSAILDVPELVFPAKKIDLGPVSVGVSTEQVVTVKNVGDSSAVFWITPPSPYVKIAPERGCILPGDSLDLLVSFKAHEAMAFDDKKSAVLLNIRGTKPLALPFAAEAVVPDVVILEGDFDFGGVTVGGNARVPISFENRGVIPAELTLDLSKHPQFSIAARPDDDEDGLSVDSEGGGAGGAGGAGGGRASKRSDHDECAIIPEDVGVPDADDDVFTASAYAAAEADASDDEDDDAAVDAAKLFAPHRFTLRIPAGATLLGDLVFQPTTARSHSFRIPLNLPGMPVPTALRRTVSAVGLEPRLALSGGAEVDFEFRVVRRDPSRRVPYKLVFEMTNITDDVVEWQVDTSSLTPPDGGHQVFTWELTSGTLQPKGLARVCATFLPIEAREYKATVPVYLDGVIDPARPYITVELSGIGIYPQLSFDTKAVLLPTVPLNFESRATFYVINTGYDYLELRHRIPAEEGPARVPLSLSFPEGTTVSMAKTRLPVQVAFKSKKAMAFTALIDFLDESGQKFTIPVSGISDNSLLTSYPYIDGHREELVLLAKPTTAPSVLTRTDAEASLKTRRSPSKSPRRRPHAAVAAAAASAPAATSSPSGSSGESKLAERKEELPSNPSITPDSMTFLIRWLNSNLLRSPIQAFPRDVVAASGRPIYDMIESLVGRPLPGRVGSRLPVTPQKRMAALYNEAKEMLVFLKGYGALLHHVRPEQLLNREAFVAIRLGANTPANVALFGEPFGAPMLELRKPAAVHRRRRKLLRQYPALCRDGWLAVVYQSIKLFVMSRLSLKQLASLPGMEPPPEPMLEDSSSQQDQGPGGRALSSRRGPGKGGAEPSAPDGPEAQALAKAKARMFVADPLLSTSNFMSVSENVLLRWLQYHHNRMNPGVKRRIVDVDRDLRDGIVMAMVILSHCPFLAEPSRALADFNRQPTTQEDYQENVQSVAAALRELGLELPMSPERLVGTGPGLSDGIGYEAALGAAVKSPQASEGKGDDEGGASSPMPTSPSRQASNVSAPSKALYDTGGVLANSASPIVELGSGHQLDCLLSALYLYQHLPQLVPKTQIDFKGALGQTVSKTIELRNPTKRPITYHVSLEGATEFSIADPILRLDPESFGAFTVNCTTRFSEPVEGRLTFRSRRDGGSAAASMVFLLRSKVTSRPPVQTFTCDTTTYTSAIADVDVSNPFSDDTTLQVSISLISAPPGVPGVGAEGGNGDSASGGAGAGAGAGAGSGAGAGAGGNGPLPSGRGRRTSTTRQPARRRGAGRRGRPGSAPATATQPAADVPGEPFWCKHGELHIRAGRKKRLPIQFLPFLPGTYVCHVVFLDPAHGEFVYELRGESKLPDPFQELRFLTEMKGTVVKDLRIPAVNQAFKQATDALDERLDRKARTQAMRLKDVKAKELLAERVDILASGGEIMVPRTRYEVELSSPFFEAPSEVLVPEEDPETAVAAARAVASSQAGDEGGEDATAASHSDHPSDVAMVLTPRGGDHPGTLPLVFHPKAPGSYPCMVTLRSVRDIRVYSLEVTVIEEGTNKGLDFAAPARKTVSQGIPIINNTDFEWSLTATITGSEYFKGPRSLTIPPKSRGEYVVSFRPDWLCEENGELVIENPALQSVGQGEMRFALHGVGEDPLAEDHIVVKCQARERVSRGFIVRNSSRTPITFAVESDLAHITGASEITIDGLPDDPEGEYELTFCPRLGGTYSGSIHFVDPSTGHYQWYTVELTATPPPPEDKLAIEAMVRQAVSLEISLTNPLATPVEFEVTLDGDGLIGDPIFTLAPNASGTYDLLFSPISAGEQKGSIMFVDEQVGEFWYELELTAHPAAPITLPHLTAAVGYRASHVISLENPLNEEVFVKAAITNRLNYFVEPPTFHIPPYSSHSVTVYYSPSSIDEAEDGRIKFVSPQLGEWIYICSGAGKEPGLHPTDIVVTASAGTSTSDSITFKNPFNESMEVLLNLESDLTSDGAAAGAGGGRGRIMQTFSLLKKQRSVLPALSAVQIPFSFAPAEINETRAMLTVHCPSRDLTWTYNIRGIAECPPPDTMIVVTCKTRQSHVESVSLVLPGLTHIDPDETFTHELVIPEDKSTLVNSALTVTPLNPGNHIDSPTDPLEFEFSLQPLKPFDSSCEFIVNKGSGGRWRYLMRIAASEPDPDDVIVIDASLNRTSSVSFELTNQFVQYAPFKAFFSPDSAVEFIVHPSEGVLPPQGSPGTSFMISFTPREYGKPSTGKLIIETEDMIWSYEVRGQPPEYSAPAAEARIDNRMDPAVASKIAQNANRSRNIMRENMDVSRSLRGKGSGSRMAKSVSGSSRK